MEFIILWAVLGIIPGVIAYRKGRGFLGWWIFGALLFIVALPLAIVRSPRTEGADAPFQTCPHCAETIKAAATVCKHCGRDAPRPATA